MDILKGQEAPLKKEEELAKQTKEEIEQAPMIKADIFPDSMKKRRKCTLSDEMVDILVHQLGSELSNYHLYRTFAGYFQRNDLPKLGAYWQDRANEENVHHNWIYNYLTECDADFSYPRVEAIHVDITDHVWPFRATVDREIETTANIWQIVNKAAEEGDWATFNFLMGDDPETGRLVREQREEESISRTILGMAEMEGSWLRKQNSILEFYNNPNAERNKDNDED